jgi:hypothetical protein
MNKYIFLVLFLTINNTLFPNDSRIMLGSSVEVIDNENTNVSMQNEVINITLHKDFYEVDVTFDFYNSGKNETVLLGFPIRTTVIDNPDEKKWAQLTDFKSYINGKLLSEYAIREESSADGYYRRTMKWYLREVEFPGNSHTYSRVTYRSPYNKSGLFKGAGYIYGTGKNWKGEIGKITIYINHGDDIIVDNVNFREKDKLFKFTWEANGRYKYEAENIEPEASDWFSMGIQPFDIYGEYHNEFGSWSDGWIWNEYLLYRDFNNLTLYTRNQIRLFINFFYAFHGYDFKNPLYKKYFQNLRSFVDYNSTKYKVNPNFSENGFNEFERKNIDYLLYLEKMIPPDKNR